MGPWSKSSEHSVKGQMSWCLYVVQSLFLVQTRLLFRESYRGVLVITSKHVHPPSPAQLKPSAARRGGGRICHLDCPSHNTHMRSDKMFTNMLLYVRDIVCGLIKHWGITQFGTIYFAFIKKFIADFFLREHFQSLQLILLKATLYTYKQWTCTLLRQFNRICSLKTAIGLA